MHFFVSLRSIEVFLVARGQYQGLCRGKCIYDVSQCVEILAIFLYTVLTPLLFECFLFILTAFVGICRDDLSW